MEALGAASSIAGLLSLVGQSIDGILKLRGFVKDAKGASKTVATFLRDVDSFQQSLSQIQHLLQQLPKSPDAPIDDARYNSCRPVLEDQTLDEKEKIRNLEQILSSQVLPGAQQAAVIEVIRIHNSLPPTIPKQTLDSLKWQLEECWDDIKEWMALAQRLDPGSATGVEAFFKKLRVAVNKDGFSEFHSQIARHQRGLGISLSVLAPTLSLLGLSQIESLNDNFQTFEQTQSRREVEITQTIGKSMNGFATQETISQTISEKIDPLKSWLEDSVMSPLAEQLERVETSTRVSVTYSRAGSENMKALSDAVSSLGTQMSQIKKMVSNGLRRSSSVAFAEGSTSESSYDSDGPPIAPLVYSCHTVVGIEEGFVENMCIYCGKHFGSGIQEPIDWRVRGLHLSRDHNFGGCESDISFHSQDECRRHLERYHNAPYVHQEDGVFLWLTRETYLSRDRDSFSANHGHDFGKPCSDSNSELSCIAEIELDLQSCLHHLELMGVEFTAIHPSDQQMIPSLSELFWEVNWKITCLKERYTIQERSFPLDAYFAMLVEAKTSTGSETLPGEFSTGLLWQKFFGEESPKMYSNLPSTECPFSPEIATWTKFWIKSAKESPPFESIRNSFRSAVLATKPPKTQLTKAIGAFKSIYIDQILQKADITADLVKDLQILKILGTGTFPHDPSARDIIKNHLAMAEESAFRNVRDSLGANARIDRWLLQILQESATSRVLSSQHWKYRTPSSPHILPWLFKTLAHWRVDDKSPDLSQSCPTDGAIDSRDDLGSHRPSLAGDPRETDNTQSYHTGGINQIDKPYPDESILHDFQGLPLRPRSASGGSLYRNALLSPRHQQGRDVPLLGERRLSLPSVPFPNPNGADQNPPLFPRDPRKKKHKCPYCETEFTRYHNLKSHLLIHSQEKPYVCATCQMRFRRLHHLKRHNKLHTGAHTARMDDVIHREETLKPANLFSASNTVVWQYVQTLEGKVVDMENKKNSAEDNIARLTEEISSLRNRLQVQGPGQGSHVSTLNPAATIPLAPNFSADKDSAVGLEPRHKRAVKELNMKKRKGYENDDEGTPYKRPRPLVPQHMTYDHICLRLSKLVAALPKSADTSAIETVQLIALLAKEMESLIAAEIMEAAAG